MTRAMSRIAITVLVAVHLGVAFWHGNAHAALAVALTPSQNAFVFLVILIGPLVGASLIWTRHLPVGVWIFSLTMLGALLFGVYHHYILVSPDNIAHLPQSGSDAHSAFITTAGALALLELGSTLYGAFCLGGLHKEPTGLRGRSNR
jgi:hypothetical protein